MNRVIVAAVVGVFLVGAVYYLFFKPYEFEIKFKASTTAGDIIETVRIWNASLGGAEVMSVTAYETLEQAISLGDRQYKLKWNFEAANDSVTLVNVQVTEPGNELGNKVLIPFSEQMIETEVGELLREFYNVLKSHLEITRVSVVGVVSMDSSFCVCRSLETDQTDKAYGMMQDYPIITSFIQHFNLVSKGPPVVRIKDWSHEAGTLKFDFCFQIEQPQELPRDTPFNFQFLSGGRALKAEYYGNYITSDRAWYKLLQYADRNGHQVKGFPIEYFHHNPNTGMNESEWKAEIYLPIVD
jgi:hypothetical protein